MSLSKFSGINPYVSDRIQYILGIADAYGGRYQVTSGVRSEEEQWELYRRAGSRPVAAPGCSQHQWGLAMDVVFEERAWELWYQQAINTVGLRTVSGDLGHAQVFPGNEFKDILRPFGLCPSPRYASAVAARERAIFDDPWDPFWADDVYWY